MGGVIRRTPTAPRCASGSAGLRGDAAGDGVATARRGRRRGPARTPTWTGRAGDGRGVGGAGIHSSRGARPAVARPDRPGGAGGTAAHAGGSTLSAGNAPSRTAGRQAAPRAATLAGVRILPAGRLRPGAWLLVREAAAMAPPVPARAGVRWDGRFRLAAAPPPPEGAMLGALGDDAARLRGRLGVARRGAAHAAGAARARKPVRRAAFTLSCC